MAVSIMQRVTQPPTTGQPKLMRDLGGQSMAGQAGVTVPPPKPTSLTAPLTTSKAVPVDIRGKAVPGPDNKQPLLAQVHGIYTNNPGFLERYSQLPWSNYAKAQPPAIAPAKPAKVNSQLGRVGYPYGPVSKAPKYDSASAFLPSGIPASPTTSGGLV